MKIVVPLSLLSSSSTNPTASLVIDVIASYWLQLVDFEHNC